MRRRALVLAHLLLWPLAAQAAQVPRPGVLDSRIQTIQYDPDQVVLLKGTLGYQFMLEFAPEEKIETVSIGDALGWQVTPNRKASVLFLKPVLQSATNLTVLTDMRRYTFELRVVPRQRDVPVLYVARLVYPLPAQVAVVEPVLPEPEAPPIVANANYAVSGSKAPQPIRIFDDGHKTYFEWAKESSLPAIFAVSDDGAESLVNYVVHGPYIVVDQIAPGFALRDGKGVAKVVNHGPVPAVGKAPHG
jgi:type IV secretion system protein VirB9